LVDTSVWIDVFRARRPLDLEELCDFDGVVTCVPVIQEVLQGFGEEQSYHRASEAMHALPIVESPLGEAVFADAVGCSSRAASTRAIARSATAASSTACGS
jgi:predicted nucleic acid-binding protein